MVRPPSHSAAAVHWVSHGLSLGSIEPQLGIARKVRLPVHRLGRGRRERVQGHLQRCREFLRQLVANATEGRGVCAWPKVERKRRAPSAHVERQSVDLGALECGVPDLDNPVLGQRLVRVSHLDEHVGVRAGLAAAGQGDRRYVRYEHGCVVNLAQDRGDDVRSARHALRVGGHARPVGFVEPH